MRQFVDDESGMTLAIAIIMIVLIGAMGAGLLTFVNRDLTTVAEENRGQRAFEMADAGVWAAKRQLTTDCSSIIGCGGHYNGSATPTLPDNQWSYTGSGMDLRDLNVDTDPTDWVNVKIEAISADTFKIISTGHYGSAMRKIEARLKGSSSLPGGTGGLGNPVYYTKSAIKIEYDGSNGISLDGISLFSQKDIMIQGLTDPASFKSDYDENGGSRNVIHMVGTGKGAGDELGDWDTMNAKYFNPTGPWNTTGRIVTTIVTKGGGQSKTETPQNDPFTNPGFAAEGKICGLSGTGAGVGSCATSPLPNSIADGISSYDGTTGRYIYDAITSTWVANTNTTLTGNYPRPVVPDSAGTTDYGRKCTFMAKPFPTTSPANTGCYITYPFPLLPPKADLLKTRAKAVDTPTDRHYWDVAVDGAPDWTTLFPGGGDWQRLVFIDARGGSVDYNPNGANKGALIVWCGSLTTNQKFQGLVFSLKGDGSSFGATNCDTNANPSINTNSGLIRNNGQFLQAWLYSNGGTSSKAGIELGAGSTIKSVPSGDWDLLNDIFDEPVPTTFKIEGWRELYS